MRRNLFILVAVIAAAIAAILARNAIQSAAQSNAPQAQSDPPAERDRRPETAVKVLVAAKTLPTGTILDDTGLTWQDWPSDRLNDAYVERKSYQPEEVVGQVLRFAVAAGQPIVRSALVGPGERGFLAAVLRPGMRAMTVPVDNISGIAGFVFPGDRVDLLVSHTTNKRKVTETVLSNVRVLAVDTRTDDQTNEPKPGRSVTLEVTPDIAERIAVARQVGTLSLVLRSLPREDGQGERELAKSESMTMDTDISAAIRRLSRPERSTSRVSQPTRPQRSRNVKEVTVTKGRESTTVQFDGGAR